MIGLVGAVGRVGLPGVMRRAVAPPAPDFALTATSVTTAWGTVVVGDLVPADAPAGVFFLLVGEPAGLAVVNG